MGLAVIPSKVNSASPDTWPGKFLTRKLSPWFAPFLTMFVWFWVVAEFCIAKFGNAHLPFYRLFVQEHVISPQWSCLITAGKFCC